MGRPICEKLRLPIRSRNRRQSYGSAIGIDEANVHVFEARFDETT